MNREQILYWLHRWDTDGMFDIDFDGLEECGLLDDLVNMKIHNPFILLSIVNRALSE